MSFPKMGVRNIGKVNDTTKVKNVIEITAKKFDVILDQSFQ